VKILFAENKYYFIVKLRGKKGVFMITMTAPTVKRAMKSIGLGDRANDFLAKLDEMALDAMLDEAVADMKKGKGIPLDQFMAEMRADFASRGYANRI
jgi:hypothetical protein